MRPSSAGQRSPLPTRSVERPDVVTRTILRNWLLVGCAGGVVGALQVYLGTERLSPALTMVGIGLALGLVGGFGRFLIEWRIGGLGQEAKRFAAVPLSHRLLGFVAAGFAIGVGFARAVDAPVGVHAALILIAVTLMLLLLLLRRNSGAYRRSGDQTDPR